MVSGLRWPLGDRKVKLPFTKKRGSCRFAGRGRSALGHVYQAGACVCLATGNNTCVKFKAEAWARGARHWHCPNKSSQSHKVGEITGGEVYKRRGLGSSSGGLNSRISATGD